MYDSLSSSYRIDELLPQLRVLYRCESKIKYVPITQQCETSCGAYAVASAFSCLLNTPPESQKYNEASMRQHLKRCMEQQKVLPFPTERLDLMSSYFAFQGILQASIPSSVEQNCQNFPQKDRKQYLLRYKQKQRRDPSFRQNEAKHKAIKRRNAECSNVKQQESRKSTADDSFKAFECRGNKRRRMDQKCFEDDLNRRQNLDKLAESKTSTKRKLEPQYESLEQNQNCKRRSDSTYKLNEHNMNKRRKLNPEVKRYEEEIHKKKMKNAECKRKLEPQYESLEQNQNCKRRSDSTYKLNEHNMNKRRKLNPEVKRYEEEIHKKKMKNAECKRKLEPQYESLEQNQNCKRRSDSTYKLNEHNMNKRRKLNPEVKRYEEEIHKKKMKNAECNRKRKQDQSYKSNMQSSGKRRRNNPECMKLEKESNQKKGKSALLEPLNRKGKLNQNEKLSEQSTNKKRKLNPEFQCFERLKRKRRLDSNFELSEQCMRKKRRLNPDLKNLENEIHQTRKENKKHKHSINRRRMDPELRKLENEFNKMRRKMPAFKTFEKNLNRKRRCDSTFMQFEKDIKQRKRNDNEYRTRERKRDRIRKQKGMSTKSKSLTELIVEFRTLVASSCDYVCTSCKQLWFKESVAPIHRVESADKSLLSKCITGVKSFDEKEWICHTCANSILHNRLPKLSSANYLTFAPQPSELDLNQLEERLVSPVNTFFQLRELPSGRQTGIRGNIVNVPADNVSIVKSLPRHIPDSQTIPVKLKKRLRYKSHYMYENIRPQKCIQATKYLLQKPLFRQYVPNGFDESWLSTHISEMRSTDWDEFIAPSNIDLQQAQPPNATDDQSMNANENSVHNEEESDSGWSEVDENDPPGTLDTNAVSTKCR